MGLRGGRGAIWADGLVRVVAVLAAVAVAGLAAAPVVVPTAASRVGVGSDLRVMGNS